ncbi:histidine kinase [Desulfonema ishimotonii]|uniref:histidine kinase n=1 Tax=Desulfonema ishimotonii TaxID=45657 RepID=A0A401FWP0_9BACT|nr:PAS domain-containing sensor histidine kinase [Desulfonema ishimotonii]GBC61385.1 histidine kinase [Desulfonema ishimotonii]
MDTYFASPKRTSEEKLFAEIDFVSKNPVISGLLHSISGLLAILDENRQIVALNDSFLQMLGIDDPAKTLGLRPGEALHCIHAYDKPAGCGTTKFCSTCGAAIAIVSSLGQDKPVERMCALSANKDGKVKDTALLVRSQPIKINKKRFLLLFIQDITKQQQRAALERTFFHDINNMLSVLVGASELIVENDPSKLAKTVHQASLRLLKEVAIQRYLSQSESCNYQPMWHDFTTEQILEELRSFFASHPVAYKKNIDFSKDYPVVSIRTDISLLLRVLCNMITNALEATAENGVVKIWIGHEADVLSFYVWNSQEIPQEITYRIFQLNFSTKGQAGRGIGTYSMKLLGEKILGGQVSFTTSGEKGTVFRFSTPCRNS